MAVARPPNSALRFDRQGGPDADSSLESGEYGIPFQSLSIVLLGPGSTVSHDALRLMARHGTALVAVGEDGVRCYTAPPLLPDTSDVARRQMRAWADPHGSRITIACWPRATALTGAAAATTAPHPLGRPPQSGDQPRIGGGSGRDRHRRHPAIGIHPRAQRRSLRTGHRRSIQRHHTVLLTAAFQSAKEVVETDLQAMFRHAV